MQATTAMYVAGEKIAVRGTYEDIRAQMADRELREDDGLREFVLEDGERITLQRGAVAWYRERVERATRRVGFV